MNILRVEMTDTGILITFDKGEPVAIEAGDAFDLSKFIIRNHEELRSMRELEPARALSRYMDEIDK